jgi:phage gp45-like
VSDGPIIIVEDPKVRIVRLTEGDKVIYVTETPDGCDAMGVERWRELKMDNKHWAAFRDFIIRGSLKEK